MIYSLRGTLLEKNVDNIVVDVNGIGFKVNVPISISLPENGEECMIYTYMSVKEDSMDLFGFADRASRQTFETLISVSGVGPKAGLAILSVMTPRTIALAIASGDYKAFTAANGVGPKVAQRITLELKGKFSNAAFEGTDDVAAVSTTATSTGNVSQAISALVALGYTQSQAALAVSKLDQTLDVQTLIKQALRLIAGGKF